MPKMIELIRESAVPANIMRSAARGALALPTSEMVEILVHLTHHPMFAEQARLTLASWDETVARQIAADPQTPPEVLEYMLAPANRRPALVAALLQNAAIAEDKLVKLAITASNELARLMLESERVRHTPDVLAALKDNPNLDEDNERKLRAIISPAPANVAWAEEDDVLALEALAKFEVEHREEIAAESSKPFKLFVPEGDKPDELAEAVGHAPTPNAAHPKHAEQERVSTVQKIARMSVGERVQLAMKGSKDERFVLVRDGSKVVCLAVLESPKLSDSEVEGFAAMKNVQEIVLRTIATKRRFIKHYTVIKNLINNPRTPIEVSLGLLPHLLVNDLKFLSMNKNVSDTVRKIALKQFKEKSSTRKG